MISEGKIGFPKDNMSAEDSMAVALDLIRQGCAKIASIDGGTDEAKRLRPAIVLLQEAGTIAKSVPDAGESGTLRWRLYQVVQAQEGSDNAAFYKELRCSIHLGLAGELSEPVTLPCGHTFCRTCLAPIFAMVGSQRKCPQCREVITVSYQSLKTNVAIKGIVAHLLPIAHVYEASAASTAAATTTVVGAVVDATQYYYGGWDRFH